MRKFSDEELLELHRKGLTDKQIAEELDVTQAAVNYRREKLGLDNNYTPNSFSDDELIMLYTQGLTDREISEALGVTQAAINYRRGRLGLRSNYVRETVFLKLYEKGVAAEEMAQKLHVPLPAVTHLMEKYEVISEKGVSEVKV